VRHPSEVVTVGQEITAKILKFDTEKNRVSLGLKQLGDDPWMGVARRYPQGTRLFGKVTNMPTTARSWNSNPASKAWCTFPKWTGPTRTLLPPRLSLGDEVEVMVLEIDEDKRRISLGMKQCKANPWDEFARTQEGRQA
jgi:small subunit ribosomal protein S1